MNHQEPESTETSGAVGTVAVIVCAYTPERLPDMDKAVASLRRQSRPADELVLVIDHHGGLLSEALHRYPDITVLANDRDKGLSGARNCGIAATSAAVVLFLDDDAEADDDWVARMIAPFHDDDIAVVGGRTIPSWDIGRPSWFPPEFDWVVGATYRGVPDRRHDVRNPFGGNAAWRRWVFEASGGFSSEVGRKGADGGGGEEAELLTRHGSTHPRERVVYEPSAVIRHRVTPDRSTVSYFVKRCCSEGRSKARVQGSGSAGGTEGSYVLHILAPALVGYGLRAARGLDAAEAAKGAAVVLGLVATASSYLVTRASLARASR